MVKRDSLNLTHILELYDKGHSVSAIARAVKAKWHWVACLLKAQGREINPVKRGPKIDSQGYLGNRIGGRIAGRWVRIHRAKAEAVLGRKLKRNEVVHHINGDKTDNRNCNLLICTQSYHRWLHDRMSELYQKEHFKLCYSQLSH